MIVSLVSLTVITLSTQYGMRCSGETAHLVGRTRRAATDDLARPSWNCARLRQWLSRRRRATSVWTTPAPAVFLSSETWRSPSARGPAPRLPCSTPVGSPVRDQAQCGGHLDEVGQRARLHLRHHSASMHLHGEFGNAEFGAHLLVHPPRHHERHDVALAGRQRGLTRAKIAKPRVLFQRDAATLQRFANRACQHFVVRWLGQEV